MLEKILVESLDNYEVFRGMAAKDDELDRLQRRAVSEEDISRLGQGCIIYISGFVWEKSLQHYRALTFFMQIV